MLRFEERDDVTVQNPPAGEVVLFYTDGAFRIKDSAGEVTTITTVEGLEEVAEATEPKVYVALLTQSGTDAPVATVLENTLGGTVVWTYNNVGVYTGTLLGSFIESKTTILTSQITGDATQFGCTRNSVDNIVVEIFEGGSSANSLLNDHTLKIEVYP